MDVYEFDDGEGGGRSPLRIVATLVVIAALAAAGWFVVKPRLSGDDNDGTATPLVPPSTTVEDRAASDPPETSTTAARLDESTTTTSVASSSTDATADATTTLAPTATADAATTSTTTAPSTTNAPTTTTAPTTGPAAPYVTLPDGNPEPVVVTFDVGRTTLTGALPNQAMSDRLAELALAYSRDPANTVIVNEVTLNPAVPTNVGVRVLELTSTRFPEGSSEILLAHAAELNRVIAALNAFPNVSVLIIGHADQRGDDGANYTISVARAEAVFNFFVSQGIAPARLSFRAVGEADLISINDDAASLALNRRTEFVFYGLLNP